MNATVAVAAPLAVPSRARAFYTFMALAAAATVYAGFAPTFFRRAQYQSTPLPLYLQIHGVVFTSWIAFFLTQTVLVAARRTAVHRTLGWMGAALASLMVIVGITAAILSGRRALADGQNDWLSFLTTPVFSMVVFLGLVAAAVFNRARPETHKRLMLLATISILDAPLARVPLAFASTTLGNYLLTDAFILPGIAFDLWSRRRVHPAYIWGALAIVLFQWLRILVGPTDAWQALARMILQ